jgi:hypothetical protein
MGGPDRSSGGIQSYGLGVGNVVAELRGFAGGDGGRRDVEAADGEFRAAQLLDGEAILFAALFGLAFLRLALVLPTGFIPDVENVRDVKDYAKNHQGRIEKGIFERGFPGRGSFGIHGFTQGDVPQPASLYLNRNSGRIESLGSQKANGRRLTLSGVRRLVLAEIHLLAGKEIFAYTSTSS